jgi:hypothetical protein
MGIIMRRLFLIKRQPVQLVFVQENEDAVNA